MSGADTDGDTTTDISFEYDALGRRVKKGSTVYAYSGQQVIAEYTSGANPSSPTEQYVYASHIDEPILKDGTLSSGTGLVYYSRNQQFSITGLTDASGNVVERYSYSAYGDLTTYDSTGTTISSSVYANAYTYTGRRLDSETEIYHFRARMYDSELGRFIGRDPLPFIQVPTLRSRLSEEWQRKLRPYQTIKPVISLREHLLEVNGRFCTAGMFFVIRFVQIVPLLELSNVSSINGLGIKPKKWCDGTVTCSRPTNCKKFKKFLSLDCAAQICFDLIFVK